MCLCNERHVDDTNQQVIDTKPYWIAKNRDIPSGRAGCTSRHSVCRCSRPARCSADGKQCRSRRRREEDVASSRATSDTL
jgi:hypothetical protein